MCRQSKHWNTLATAAVVTLATGVVGAHQAAQSETFMTAERSRAIQSELARIDADRAAWVSAFLGAWHRALDPRLYDVRQELTGIAMKAPAWQLYGASLVGDFTTMVQVMRGLGGAGRLINTIATPQVKMRPSIAVRPLTFGTGGNELVFTPVPPCRVVDTRPGPSGAGARTGILAANTSRDFDLDTGASTSGQGGGPFPCPSLPVLSQHAWAVNITVVGTYAAQGGLKAWGFGATEPNASVINWQAGQSGAIANGVILIGCFACADDITVKAFGDATDVIIDVMGYYREAGVAAVMVSRVAGLLTMGGTGTVFQANGGQCPAGTTLVGGEHDFTNDVLGLYVVEENSLLDASRRWTRYFGNETGSSQTVTVYSRCMDTPIQVF